MRFLERQHPRIHEAVVEMFALPSKRTGPRPRRDYQVVRLVEVFAVVRGIGVIGELLAACPAHPSRHQPPAGDHIDHREFFGQAQRIRDDRRRITQQHDLHAPGLLGEDRRLDVHHRAHTERRPMMFVEHHAVEAKFVRVKFLVEVLIQELRALGGIEIRVRNAEEAVQLKHLVFGNVMVRTFGKPHYVHGANLRSLNRENSRLP